MMFQSTLKILRSSSFVNNFRNKTSRSLSSDLRESIREKIKNGPGLSEFIQEESNKNRPLEPFIWSRKMNQSEPYIEPHLLHGNNAKVFVRTYGCQMNVNDTDITTSILSKSGYEIVNNEDDADIVLLMTCAIRENAEQKVWTKLHTLSISKREGTIKSFGLLGCMAERLKTKVLEQLPTIDVIAGPDTYRALPKLLAINNLTGQNAVNVLLSLDETYDDILPQFDVNKPPTSSFVSITRGCNNMCSYCIVPFTRGRERSRKMETIINEVKHHISNGVKEITLLGQNVNSYRDFSQSELPSNDEKIKLADGFKTIYKLKTGGIGFETLLDNVAQIDPNVRIRFTSPHPKDFNDEVIKVIAKHPNIAKGLHMPAQSGSDLVLERMRRGYTKEAYIQLVQRIRKDIPDCAINSDFICGFCDETEADHLETLDLVEKVGYHVAYIFAYSMREKTHAHHHMEDNVSQEVKIRRLTELGETYRRVAAKLNQKAIHTNQLILVEGVSKKSKSELYGRNEAHQKVIIPASKGKITFKPGDYLNVFVTDCTSLTLIGDPIEKTTITKFYS